MKHFIEPIREEIDVKLMSPLTLAYVGDAVYELYIRTYLTNVSNLKPHKLHLESIKYVKAVAQAGILDKLHDILTEEEKDMVRRGRNQENHHSPKNVSTSEYSKSTAFETLIGFLYLTKREERLEEILNYCVNLT